MGLLCRIEGLQQLPSPMGTLCRGGGVIADTLCYEEGEGCYDGIPWAQIPKVSP